MRDETRRRLLKQSTQKLENGSMSVIEVPAPVLGAGSLLVRNVYSLNSAGTESSTVRTARMGYLSKAKERPQQVSRYWIP
jgi:polar amino acid transport system substrate-binding protein